MIRTIGFALAASAMAHEEASSISALQQASEPLLVVFRSASQSSWLGFLKAEVYHSHFCIFLQRHLEPCKLQDPSTSGVLQMRPAQPYS